MQAKAACAEAYLHDDISKIRMSAFEVIDCLVNALMLFYGICDAVAQTTDIGAFDIMKAYNPEDQKPSMLVFCSLKKCTKTQDFMSTALRMPMHLRLHI